MKKKYLIISISVLLVLTTCLYVFMSDNTNRVVISSEEGNKSIVNTNALTMMYETEAGSGEYQVSSDTTWPQDDYVFNETLSKCENGGILTWDDESKKVLMQTNTSDKCYVYFDKLEILVDLNNYTFTWEPVDGATSYQILSNGELLTTTSSTSAEIYQYYNEPNTYNIVIQALDDTGKVLMESITISYTIEKLSVDISGYGIEKYTVFDDTNSFPDASKGSNYTTVYVYNREEISTINNNNYTINYFFLHDLPEIKYKTEVRSGIGIWGNEDLIISNNYCISSNLCNS